MVVEIYLLLKKKIYFANYVWRLILKLTIEEFRQPLNLNFTFRLILSYSCTFIIQPTLAPCKSAPFHLIK